MPRLHALILFVALFLSCTVTGGCSRLQMSGILPSCITVSEVGTCDGKAPFELDPKGENVAFVDNGLKIHTPASANSRVICPDSPCALAWSPDSSRIAAAFSHDNDGSLRIYGLNGELQGEVKISGRISSLAWRSSTEILALNLLAKQFSFGTNLAEIFLLWDGTGKPRELVTFDTTVKPNTMKQWGNVFMHRLTFKLSPLNDEILYVSVTDPPVFNPYYKIFLLNLESGKTREVANVSLNSGGGSFSDSGESVLFGDGESSVNVLDPWGNMRLRTIQTPGRELAASPGGRYQMLDGHLYCEGTQIVSFQENCGASFSNRGGRLAMECGNRLYVVSGLTEDLPAPLKPEESSRQKELRKWLSEGLITFQDYRRFRERSVQ